MHHVLYSRCEHCTEGEVYETRECMEQWFLSTIVLLLFFHMHSALNFSSFLIPKIKLWGILLITFKSFICLFMKSSSFLLNLWSFPVPKILNALMAILYKCTNHFLIGFCFPEHGFQKYMLIFKDEWKKTNVFKNIKRSKHLHPLTEEKSVEKKFTKPLKILQSELVHSQRGNFYECNLNLSWQLENSLGVRNVNFIFLYLSFLCVTQNIVQGIKWVHAVIYVQMALGPMKLHFYQTENDNLRLE